MKVPDEVKTFLTFAILIFVVSFMFESIETPWARIITITVILSVIFTAVVHGKKNKEE